MYSRTFFLILKGIISLCLYFMFNMVLGQSSTAKYKHYTIDDGLSQSTVLSITQDHYGFMWFGTKTGGLNKFDGNTFTSYKYDYNDSCSISGNEIISIYEDSRHNLWVGTRNDGLNLYDHETGCFKRFSSLPKNDSTVSQNTIKQIYEDSENRLWIVTNGGISQYDYEQGFFIRHLVQTKLFINCIVEAKDKQLWLGTKSGLILFNPTTGNYDVIKSEKGKPTSLASNNISALWLDKAGSLWLGTRNHGINKLIDPISKTFTTYQQKEDLPNGIQSNIIRQIQGDKEGNIWFCTKKGLEQLKSEQQNAENPQFIHHIADPFDENSLNQNSIYSFFEDRNGDFWIGTWGGGVNYMNKHNQKFKHYRNQTISQNSLNNNLVSCFLQEGDQVWVGTEGGGINLFNRETEVFDHLKKEDNIGLQSNHIKSFFVDTDSNLWVGTFNGLHLYDRKSKTFKHYLEGKSVYTIVGGMPNELWIGTYSKLYRMDKAKRTFKSYRASKVLLNNISNNAINDVLFDSNQNIWVATKFGLNLYNRSSDSFIRFIHTKGNPNSISHSHITSLYEDPNGNLWIGTEGGLNLFNKKDSSFILFDERLGFKDNVVHSIIGDTTGNLWISTNKGLSVLKIAELDLTNLERSILRSNDIEWKKYINNYDKADGLQGNEFIKNSCYINTQGELFFGGNNGFNIFHPNQLYGNATIPKILITKMKLFHEVVVAGVANSPLKNNIKDTKEIVLTHNQSTFTFNFLALDYTAPEKNQYAYMLEGIDNDWVYIGNKREVSYTKLPAGKYVFKVKGSNSDLLWNDKGVALTVTILPAWWETLWFKTLLIVFILAAFLGFYKYRVYNYKRAQRVLETKVTQRTQKVSAQAKELQQQAEELRQQAEELETQRDHLDHQNKVITEINDNMMASINYAQTIQEALLPFNEMFDKCFQDYCILYRPKDIVSGDFYWLTKIKKMTFFAVADCTGHGVPGAFMSMISISLLNDIVHKQKITETHLILETLDLEIRKVLKQAQSGNDDGLDIVLCSLVANEDDQALDLHFTGAKNSLFYFNAENKELLEIKGNKRSIGGRRAKKKKDFSSTHLKVKRNDILYLITDGILDQHRQDRKRIGKMGFLTILNQVFNTLEPNLNQHLTYIETALDEHQQDEKQRDDISMVGIKI